MRGGRQETRKVSYCSKKLQWWKRKGKGKRKKVEEGRKTG